MKPLMKSLRSIPVGPALLLVSLLTSPAWTPVAAAESTTFTLRLGIAYNNG
ncbi:MAG: hypothetical protein JRH19_26710, partial [Deltaproteobacteria bacterium]|nr:hypothetical protein [Deltaproteobacteria bacterium]